jgi:hypothetical protein
VSKLGLESSGAESNESLAAQRIMAEGGRMQKEFELIEWGTVDPPPGF